MRNLVILLLLFTVELGYSQVEIDSALYHRLNEAEKRITDIEMKDFEKDLETLNERLAFQQKIIEQSANGISNQLSAASNSLTLFGLLFGIGAIILGVYVTSIERKIVKIGEENNALLLKNQKIKEDVDETQRLIHDDIHRIFLKIKREETVHTLDRLMKIPQDIVNVAESLLARELEQEDYLKLKTAYMSLKSLPQDSDQSRYSNRYEVLFFQHFFGRALKDEEVRPGLSEFMPRTCVMAFKNDLIKASSEFADVLVEKGIQEYIFEVNQLFSGLTASEHKNCDEVYRTLFLHLKSRDRRFQLFDVVESDKTKRYAKITYGELLRLAYEPDFPTRSELSSFNTLDELISAERDEEEQRKLEEQRNSKI